MGDEDIILELSAEAVPPGPTGPAWRQPVTIHGRCNIGCKGRKMLDTKNLVVALNWVDYHRSGNEHIGAFLARREGSGVIVGPFTPTSQLADEVPE